MMENIIVGLLTGFVMLVLVVLIVGVHGCYILISARIERKRMMRHGNKGQA